MKKFAAYLNIGHGADWKWWGPVVIFLVGILLYGFSLRNDFVYDDLWTIVHNSSIESVLPLSKFLLDPSTVAHPSSGIQNDVYRPLSTFSFAINRTIGGLAPFHFRLVNLLFHVLNGILLWFLFRRWFSPGAALGGALFFVIHPVQVESVVWITQRSILLCGVGVLSSLLLWEMLSEKPWALALLCCSFLFALLGKEAAIGLPLVFLFRLRGGNRKDKFAFLASIGILVAYLVFRRFVLGHWGQDVPRETNLIASVAEGISALPLYLKHLVWPFGLNVSYAWFDVIDWRRWELWAGMIIIVAWGFSFVFTWAKKSLAFFGLMLVFAFWLPHSGFRPLITFAADRFLYLPMIGVCFLVAWVGEKAHLKFSIVAILISMFAFSFMRIQDWRSESALWASSVRQDSHNAFAQACYAQSLLFEGKEKEALKHYDMALQQEPTVSVAHRILRILVRIHTTRGEIAEAQIYQQKLDESQPPSQ